jgi:hypothetical protein
MNKLLDWYRRLYRMLQLDADASPLRLTAEGEGRCTIGIVCDSADDIAEVVLRLRSVADALEGSAVDCLDEESKARFGDHHLVLTFEGPPHAVLEIASTFGPSGSSWRPVPDSTILVRRRSRFDGFSATVATKAPVSPINLWAIARAFPQLRISAERLGPDGKNREAVFERGVYVEASSPDLNFAIPSSERVVVEIGGIDRDTVELGFPQEVVRAGGRVVWICGIALAMTGRVIDVRTPRLRQHRLARRQIRGRRRHPAPTLDEHVREGVRHRGRGRNGTVTGTFIDRRSGLTMAIDVSLRWPDMTDREQDRQDAVATSAEGGRFGYLRESYVSEIYATRVLVPESFKKTHRVAIPGTELDGVPFAAKLLRERLDKTIATIRERERLLYGLDEAGSADTVSGFVAFVALAERMERKHGGIYVWTSC